MHLHGERGGCAHKLLYATSVRPFMMREVEKRNNVALRSFASRLRPHVTRFRRSSIDDAPERREARSIKVYSVQ